ncbi:hypothetical protein ACT17S_00275 [Glutamicibacter mysorens]
MNLISCVKEFRVESDCTPEHFEEHVDAIADALFDLEQAWPKLLDSSVGADLVNKVLEITVTVEHEGITEGQAYATSMIRKAIGMSGGHFGDNADSMVETKSNAELVAA